MRPSRNKAGRAGGVKPRPATDAPPATLAAPPRRRYVGPNGTGFGMAHAERERPVPTRLARAARTLAVLAPLGSATPLAAPALAQQRPPGTVSGPAAAQDPALRQQLDILRGRVDELGIELQRQERMLGALLARPPAGPAAAADPPAAPAPAPDPPRAPPPAAQQAHPQPDPHEAASRAPALIVMVGNDGALTLEGRPAALPTLDYALKAAAAGDVTRRVVVGAEPEASPAQVGEVVAAVSRSGFGRITITGP